MAENVNANIDFTINTQQAVAAMKQLQSQISAFHSSMARGSAQTNAASRQMQQNLIDSINTTGRFDARLASIQSTTEAFTTSLEKNKFSLGEYFRYAGGASRTFGKMFSKEFSVIEKVATERVKDLQTQFISMGRDANGVLQSIKIRPLALDMTDLGTQTQMAAQKTALLNKLVQQGSTNMLNWGKNTQWAGRQLMVGFTVPLTMLGSIAAKSFMDIEEQIIKIRRVYGDFSTTVEDTDKIVSSIRTLASEFTKYGVAVQDTMSLAAEVAATGKMGADLVAQVTEATRLAVLGNVKQSEAMQTTMSITNAFGTATEDLAGKIDFLNAVENQSVTAIEDLTIAIPKAGPVIQQLGGDVEDLAFFLTAMREGGINASEGANALKSGLASLINPSNKASEFLGKFGINIDKIVNSNKGDIKGLVTEFATSLDTLDPLNRARAIEQLFGKFQFSRLSTLFQNVNKQGSQAQRVLQLAQSSSEELAIVSERELARVAESSTYKFKKSVSDFQSALAPVGEEFLKAITPFINMATNILKSFNQMSGGAKQFATNLTLFIGGVGPAVLMTVGLIANGVANLIKFFSNMRNVFSDTGSESENLGESTQYMTQAQIEAAAVASSLDQAHSTLIQTFGVEGVALASLVDKYQKAIAVQEEYRRKTGNFGPGNAGNPPGYASGVVSVPGPKGAGDIVPAMLSPGEAVIPAGMTSRYRPLIEGMISGSLPGYKKGGIIGDTYRIGPTDRVGRDQIEKAIRVIARPPLVGNNVNYELNEALAVFADLQQQAALAEADVYRRQEISDIDKIVDSQGLQSKFESGLPGRGGSEQLDNYRRTVSETIYDKASEGKPGSEVYGFLKAPVLPFDISEIIPIINSVGLELGINPAEIQEKILSQLERSNDSILKSPAVGGYGEVDLKFNRDAMIASNAQAVIGDTLSSSTDNLLEYNARMAAIKGMPIAKLLAGDYTDEERAAMFGPSNVPTFYEVAIPQSAATLENIDLATLVESTAKRQMVDKDGRFVAYKDSQISLDSVKNAESALGRAGIPFDTSAYEDEAMVSLLTAHIHNMPLPEYVGLDGTPITVEEALAKFERVKKGGSSWDKEQMVWNKIPGLQKGGIIGSKAVAAFGAHQPFTVAHEMIAKLGQEMAATQGGVFKQFSTMQGKSKRSLLEDELKKRLIEESVGVTPEFVNNPFGLMESLSLQGIKDLTLLLGEDRMDSSVFDLAAEQYGINLQKVGIPRDPDSPSGTKTRLAISNNDVEAYKQLIASGATDETKSLVFDQMRTAMGLEDGGIIGGPVPIKIRSRESIEKQEAVAEGAYQAYLASSLAGQEPEPYVRQHAPSTGFSFPIPGVGGMYTTPDGRGVFVKAVLSEQDARAEMMGTEIARSGHNLKAPQQRMVVLADPTDLTGRRRFLGLESPHDPTFAPPEQQSFTKDQFFKQLVASLVRSDKDLQTANLFGDVLADVGPAGVFPRASGARSITSELPSMEEQAMVNLLGIKGGAKKDFAENTLGIAQSMTAEEYNAGVQAEIQRVLPQLRSTIGGFDLKPEEEAAYAAMIQRLEAGQNVDWSQFHGVHTAVQPRVLKMAQGGIVEDSLSNYLGNVTTWKDKKPNILSKLNPVEMMRYLSGKSSDKKFKNIRKVGYGIYKDLKRKPGESDEEYYGRHSTYTSGKMSQKVLNQANQRLGIASFPGNARGIFGASNLEIPKELQYDYMFKPGGPFGYVPKEGNTSAFFGDLVGLLHHSVGQNETEKQQIEKLKELSAPFLENPMETPAGLKAAIVEFFSIHRSDSPIEQTLSMTDKSGNRGNILGGGYDKEGPGTYLTSILKLSDQELSGFAGDSLHRLSMSDEALQSVIDSRGHINDDMLAQELFSYFKGKKGPFTQNVNSIDDVKKEMAMLLEQQGLTIMSQFGPDDPFVKHLQKLGYIGYDRGPIVHTNWKAGQPGFALTPFEPTSGLIGYKNGGIVGQGKVDTSIFNTDFGQTPGGFQEVEGIMHYLKKPRNKAEGTAELVAAELYRRLGGTGLAMKSFPEGVIGSEELPGVINTYETTLESWIRSQPDPIAASETLLQALSHYAQNDAPLNSLLGNIDTHPGNIMFDPVSKRLVNMDLGNSILTGMDTWDSEFSELATDEALAMKERILTAIRVGGGRDNRETLAALAQKYGFDNFAGLATEEPSNKVDAKGKISLLQKLMGFGSKLTGDQLLNADPRNNKFIQQLIAENPGLEQRLSFGKLATTSGDSMTESLAQLYFRSKAAQSDSVFKYANGVVSVPGPKGAGDVVPAMLSPGEAVIPARMTARYQPLIKGMIAGNIPGYMAGRDPNAGGPRRRRGPEQTYPIARDARYTDSETNQEVAPFSIFEDMFSSGEITSKMLDVIAQRIAAASEKSADLKIVVDSYLSAIEQLQSIGSTDALTLKRVGDYGVPNLAEISAQNNGRAPKNVDVYRENSNPEVVSNTEMFVSNLTQNLRDEFSHLAEGVKVLASDMVNAPSKDAGEEEKARFAAYEKVFDQLPQKLQERILQAADKGQYVEFLGTLGIDLKGAINEALAGSGADVSKYIREFDAGDAEKWKKSIISGGGNFEMLSESTRRLDEIFTGLIQNSGANIIVDKTSQIADVQAANPDSIVVSQYQLMQQAVQELSQSADAADRALAAVLLRAEATTGDVRIAGGSLPSTGYGKTGGLQLSEADALLIEQQANDYGKSVSEAIRSGLESAFEIASPSRVGNEVGKNVADGVVQGAESTVPDATAAGQNVANAIVAPFEAEAEARKVNDIMDQLMAKGATKEQALLQAQNFVNNTPGDGLTPDEQKQKNRAGAYKVARTTGLIASGLSMAGSFLPGQLGEMAQKAVGPITAATTAMQMIPGPWGVAAGAIALVGSVFLEVNKSLDETRAKASALTQALGTGAKAMDAYAKFAGNATASEVMSKRRASAQTGYSVQQGKSEFGRSFLGSEEGQAMLSNVEQGIQEIGRTATIKKLGDQLTMAVVSGALSEKQAQSISYSLGQELQDFGFTIGISTRIKDVVGVNGKKIEGNELEIASKITGTAVKDLNGIFDNIQKINADGGMFSGFDLAKLEGQAAGGIIDLVSAQQQIADSLELQYSKRIKNLESQGRLNEATALALELEGKKTELLEANTKNLESVLGINFDELVAAATPLTPAELRDNVDGRGGPPTMQERRDAIEEGFKTPDASVGSKENTAAIESEVIMRTRAVFAGTEEEARANTLIDKIRSNTPSELGIVLTANLAAGNIGLDNLEMFSNLFEGNEQAYTILASVSASLGGPAADQMIRLLDFFPPGVDAPQKRIDFMTNINTMDPAAAEKTLNALTTLGNYSGIGGLNIQAIMDFYVTNPAELENFMASMTELDELKKAGKLNVRSILEQNILVVGSEEAFKDNAEYFNSLDPENQVLYTQTFITQYQTIGADAIAARRAADPEGSAGKTDDELKGIMSAEGATQVTKSAEAAARLAKETKKANDELSNFAGTAFDRLTAVIDVLNKKLSIIQKKEDKINKKYDERRDALEEIAKINEQIAKQQEGQLDLADALARGDVTAAARAIQKSRAEASAYAMQQQQEVLEKQREAELKTVSFGGETRESIEKKLARLEMRLAKRDYKDALEYLTSEGASANTGGGGSGSSDDDKKPKPPKPPKPPKEPTVPTVTSTSNAFKDSGKTTSAYMNVVDPATVSLLQQYKDRLKALPKEAFEAREAVEKKIAEMEAGLVAKRVESLRVLDKKETDKVITQLANEKKIQEQQRQSQAAYRNSGKTLSGYLSAIDKGSSAAKGFAKEVAKTAVGKGTLSINAFERMGFALGGIVPKYFAAGGYAMGTDTIPAMLTPGEFIVSRPAVENFGVENLQAINSGKSMNDSVYNYNVTVNAATSSNADEIARTVMQKIKQVEGSRLRGNRY